MNATTTLLVRKYRKAVEARQRYVIGQRVAKLPIDQVVDSALINGVFAAREALVELGGNDDGWFVMTDKAVDDQVTAELLG